MRFEIEKVLLIHSPKQFYRILMDKNYLSGGVDNFLKKYFKWQYGCPCDSDYNWQEVEKEFRKLEDEELCELKRKIKCDKIEFRYDDN